MIRDTSLLLPGNAGFLLLQPFFEAASAAIRDDYHHGDEDE